MVKTQNKVALAREIAYRTKPRFVDIPREKRVTRYTAYDNMKRKEKEAEEEK